MLDHGSPAYAGIDPPKPGALVTVANQGSPAYAGIDPVFMPRALSRPWRVRFPRLRGDRPCIATPIGVRAGIRVPPPTRG